MALMSFQPHVYAHMPSSYCCPQENTMCVIRGPYSAPILIPTFMTNILVVQKLKWEHTQACKHRAHAQDDPKSFFFSFSLFKEGK